jgi:hypothetical protein
MSVLSSIAWCLALADLSPFSLPFFSQALTRTPPSRRSAWRARRARFLRQMALLDVLRAELANSRTFLDSRHAHRAQPDSSVTKQSASISHHKACRVLFSDECLFSSSSINLARAALPAFHAVSVPTLRLAVSPYAPPASPDSTSIKRGLPRVSIVRLERSRRPPRVRADRQCDRHNRFAE